MRRKRRDILLTRYEFVKRKQHQELKRPALAKPPVHQHAAAGDKCSDCSSSSSSSSSSSVSSSSDEKSKKPHDKKKPPLISQKQKTASEQQRAQLTKVAAIMNEFRAMVLTRQEMCEHVEKLYFSKMVTGAFARVVSGPGQYRVVRIKEVIENRNDEPQILVSKEGTGARKVRTRLEIVCEIGRQSKKLQIKLVSNTEPTTNEVEKYVKSLID